MNLEDKAQSGALGQTLILAPGAADVSEGTVCRDIDNIRDYRDAAAKSHSGETVDSAYKIYAEKQSGEGFWSVDPGCTDISEGMVWVARGV